MADGTILQYLMMMQNGFLKHVRFIGYISRLLSWIFKIEKFNSLRAR